jgi:hypothetical protein
MREILKWHDVLFAPTVAAFADGTTDGDLSFVILLYAITLNILVVTVAKKRKNIGIFALNIM